MALTHLLDTSVLTRLRQPAIRAALEGKAEWGQLARAGISDLEIGYSARNGSERDRLAEALEVFELIQSTAEQIEAGVAGHRHRPLLRQSRRPRGLAVIGGRARLPWGTTPAETGRACCRRDP